MILFVAPSALRRAIIPAFSSTIADIRFRITTPLMTRLIKDMARRKV
jgi:hypothetical protein